MMDDPKPIKVTYEFLLPEHQNELQNLQYGNEWSSALWEIDNMLRDSIKYGQDEQIAEYAEKVRRLIPTSVWET